MRIFIDAAIVKPNLGGIATYVSELARALARRPDVRVCVATSFADGLFSSGDGVEVIELPAWVRRFQGRAAWREKQLGGLASHWRADVVIAPTPEVPARRLPMPQIVVVLDLGPLQAPAIYGRWRWVRFTLGVPLACRRADHVVCLSHATLLALRQCVGTFDAPCSVVGAADRPLPSRHRRVEDPPYILNVGSMLEHKNIRTLLAAMNEPGLADVRLRLAGPLSDRERERLSAWTAQVLRPERVTHAGFTDLDTLADLYAGAAAVALPSLYEGLGLPLLEAMRAGVPVVASAIPAHLEVGGNAAIFVEQPLSAAAWSLALSSVVRDRTTNELQSHKGREHVRPLSWNVVADQMAHVVRAVLARRWQDDGASNQRRP